MGEGAASRRSQTLPARKKVRQFWAIVLDICACDQSPRFGLGMELLEGSHLKETTGRYANGNFADYLVATSADVPYIDVHLIGKPDTIFNPIGARGAGEIGVTGISAAITNAVCNATGQRIRDFPIILGKLILPTQGLATSTADDR